MEDFIYEVHDKTLSPQARQLLYLQEVTKPAELQGLSRWPAWNITNRGYLEGRKQQEIAALAAFEANAEALLVQQELKDQEERLIQVEVENLYELARADNDKNNFENGEWLGKPRFTIKAKVYQKAWDFYCKPNALNKKTPSTRDACIKDLTNTFRSLISDENNNNDNDYNDDDDEIQMVNVLIYKYYFTNKI